jgi:ketosteroid isomerase-like protein
MPAENDALYQNAATPERGADHAAMEMFLGKWTAKGTAYGAPDQSSDDPKSDGVPWVSEHCGYWHTGEFFLIQDEKARPGGKVFDTISLMGVDPETGEMFARSFENNGYYRHYTVTRQDKVWTLSGTTERATITFSDDLSTQTIVWEWKPADRWLPLCDRIATRVEASDEQEVRQVIDQWMKSVQAGDMAGILANHSDDLLMFDVSEPIQLRGMAEYQETWDYFYSFGAPSDDLFVIEQLDVTPGAEVAFATGLLRIGGSEEPICRLTLGLKKVGGHWLIAHEHHSAADPREEPKG